MGRRLFIFSIGFFGGCVLVWFMFFRTGERSFYGNWLPDGRVLHALRGGLISTSAHTECMLQCLGIFKSRMNELLKDGDINFGESVTQGKRKEYEVVHQDLHMRFILAGDSVRLGISMHQKVKSCVCE